MNTDSHLRPAPALSASPAGTARPTREQLLADFGDDYLSIQSLFSFCFVPSGRLNLLKELAVEEDWGANHFALLKYLAVHLRLAIEQGRYVWNGEQVVLAAGRLSTRLGAPLYLGLVPNQQAQQDNPWVLNWVGERPASVELPEPATLGSWPLVQPGAEVLVACDLYHQDRSPRLPLLAGWGDVAQVCALTGAAHWSLHRGLAVRQLHGAGRGFFVPLWLRSRGDLESVPDVVVPVVPQGERLVVRTLLEPHVAYSPARVCVERSDQLPGWLLEAWDQAAGAGARDPGEAAG